MSQKSQSDGGQKHFAVGRGLLAAAETLNFSMNEQRSTRQMGGMASGVGVGGGGMEGQDGGSPMSRRANNLGSTMKLFASLGLSPSDLDALAEIPEEDISVETLPRILMQLKNRKADAGERRGASSMSSDAAYRGGSWDDVPVGRMGGPSLGHGSARAQPSADFGFGSLQDVSPGRGYGLNYGSGGGGGSRDRPYSELSHRDSYSSVGPSTSESVFMQRRMGCPSNGKVQDFLGVMPTMFPHVCSLCDFDVHSTMEWNQHINGLKHGENRRLLVSIYPDWDPGMSSGRGGGLLDRPNLSAGLLGPAPMSSAQTAGGMSSSWGGGPGLPGKNLVGQNKLRSRVVVVKYDRKPLSNKTLFALAEPFGCLREHMVLNNKAFLEMSSHEEAQEMVNYYKQSPAHLYGKPISMYQSRSLLVIDKDKRPTDRSMDRSMDRPGREFRGQGSQVVFFSNLPREDEKKKELLTIAGRFGLVEKHLFLTDQAFVQLGTPEDAEMLVKYYSVNPLTIKGRLIRLNICAKYKTLNVNQRQGDKRGRGASSSRTSSSPKTPSSKSSSSSRSKEEKKREEEEEEEEPEEEVSGVMEGEEVEDERVTDGDAEGEEPMEETLKEREELQKEEAPAGGDVTDDTPGAVGGAEAMQGAGPEEQTEEETSAETAEGDAPAEESDGDFLENMDDFVTLDEVAEDEDDSGELSDTIDNSRRGGMRVVSIVGFRRGFNFLNELLALAKPFGKVVKHLVLDLRAEAFLQFETEEEARAMSKFYNSNISASVCGRPVRICHSMSYPTIQCGSSKVVYIGQIPSSKYSDESILKLAEPFGRVTKYFINRIRRECFLEMEDAEAAEKMAQHCKENPLKFNKKRLNVYVSRKYRQLKYGHRCVPPNKRENSSSSPKPEEPPAKRPREEEKPEEEEGEEKKEEEEKPEEEKKEKEKPEEEKKKEEEKEKKEKEKPEEEKKEEEKKEEKEKPEEEEKKEKEKPEEEKKKEEEEKKEEKEKPEEEEKKEEKEKLEVVVQSSDMTMEENSAKKIPEVCDLNQMSVQEVKQEVHMEGVEISSSQNGETKNKPSVASLPLPPHDPETPIGVEHVKTGFYCRVCFLFYSNEETAKKTHCSSKMHYDKLQKHLEKEQTKAEKKKGKKTMTTM